MGWSFRREGTYVYLWLLHIVIWQKPTHYKAIILQLNYFLKNGNLRKQYNYRYLMDFPIAQMVKNLPIMQETRVQSSGSSIPVFLPGESHGERSLAGYSPWGHKELDMTK